MYYEVIIIYHIKNDQIVQPGLRDELWTGQIFL